MKKNDHRSNVGTLKMRKTTQSNGVKFQRNKIFIRVIRRKMPSEIPCFQKEMLSTALLSVYNILSEMYAGSFKQRYKKSCESN